MEQRRLQTIKENQERLKMLGLGDFGLKEKKEPRKSTGRRESGPVNEVLKGSLRERTKTSYTTEVHHGEDFREKAEARKRHRSGSECSAPPQYGDTALTTAARRGNLDCLKHLIAKGANLETTSSPGWATSRPSTALIEAAINGELACLEHLIAKGANVNATNEVSAAPPAAPTPLCPSSFALAARRPCCPALTAAAHRVWRRRRASAERRDGPHEGG